MQHPVVTMVKIMFPDPKSAKILFVPDSRYLYLSVDHMEVYFVLHIPLDPKHHHTMIMVGSWWSPYCPQPRIWVYDGNGTFRLIRAWLSIFKSGMAWSLVFRRRILDERVHMKLSMICRTFGQIEQAVCIHSPRIWGTIMLVELSPSYLHHISCKWCAINLWSIWSGQKF